MSLFPERLPTRETLGASLQATREWSETYLDGLDSVAELQRKLVRGTPLEPFSELLTVPARATRRFVESYVTAIEGLVPAAERATKPAGRAASEVVERAAASAEPAARKQGEAIAGPADEPIARYDSLTAEAVAEKLPELPQSTVAEVDAYERAHQGRTTVLSRTEALRADQPAPGYDELNASEIQKLLAEGDVELARSVRDYERKHKNRSGVLRAAERRIDPA